MTVMTNMMDDIHDQIIALLKKDSFYNVILKGGRNLDVYNIAWGKDFDEVGFHITTNISPDVDGASVDFFSTQEVLKIVENNVVLLDLD